MNAIEAVTRDGEVIPLSRDLGLKGRVLRVGWDLPNDLSEADWLAAGELLGKVEHSVSWWIGDWWAFGEARYGQCKEIVQSDDWEGPAYQTCVNAGNVCEKFESNRRRLDLSFKHHAEVASLEPHEQDALLDWAEQSIPGTGKPRSTRELRSEVSKRRVTSARQLGMFDTWEGAA